MRTVALLVLAAGALGAQPVLPLEPVADWLKLPKGWNLGETSGVAIDAQDHVWIFNRGKHPVVEVDRAGAFIQAWPEPPIVASHGIKVDPDGNVWTVDVEAHRVMKFTRDGRLLMVLGGQGAKPAPNNDDKYAFNRPTGLSFKPSGDFYVSDGYINSRVVEYNRSGEYVRHWGKKGKANGEFDLAHDVTLDPRGRVYVADRANNRIQVFSPEGNFLQAWSNVGQPWGLVYSKKDNALWMADGLANRISKLNLDGQVLGTYGGFGHGAGQFDFAHHIAVDSAGAVYVAEIKNWRVQKLVEKK